MDVGDATSTTSMDVVKVGLEKQVGLKLREIQGWKVKNLKKKNFSFLFTLYKSVLILTQLPYIPAYWKENNEMD